MRPQRLSRQARQARQAASVPPPAAWYEITYANPGRRHKPATASEEDAALDTARRMSARGDVVDVTLVLDDGSSRPIASFADSQPVPGAAARVPAAADAAQAPVSRLLGIGDIRAAALRYPDGISPLPVAATSGGPLRPRRLLHPDSTRLVCRPDGRSGPRWAGVADGVVPSGSEPDTAWLQVVRRNDPAGLVTLHPALISPAGVDPYACMDRRQRRRFGAFDAAEAAGHAAARLPAVLVDVGDFITADGRDGILQVSQSALVCGSDGRVGAAPRPGPQRRRGHADTPGGRPGGRRASRLSSRRGRTAGPAPVRPGHGEARHPRAPPDAAVAGRPVTRAAGDRSPRTPEPRMLEGPRTDDEIIAHVLVRTWELATGRTLRSDVPPGELGEAELISFWADDQTAGPARQPAA